MTHAIEIIKRIVAVIIGFLNSAIFYFMPIKQLVEVLFALFVLSYIIGVIHSIRYDLEDISKTKTFKAITEFAVYTALIAGFFIVGERMNADNMVMKFIEVVTWGLIYLYTTNIFKNLTRLFTHAKGLRWIYFILNLEFLKRFPQLKDFEEKEKHDENS